MQSSGLNERRSQSETWEGRLQASRQACPVDLLRRSSPKCGTVGKHAFQNSGLRIRTDAQYAPLDTLRNMYN